MNDIISAATIRKQIRMHYGIEYSLETINHVAQKIGYKPIQYGNLRGYHKSVYTALQRRWSELNEYEEALRKRKAQKENKWQNTYNPDTFHEPEGRKDYAWEADENLLRKALVESVKELFGFDIL